MMTSVSAVFAMIFMLFFYGILTMHLIADMDIGENSVGKILISCFKTHTGYFFGLICATYALSSPFIGLF